MADREHTDIDRLINDFLYRLQDLNLPTGRELSGFADEFRTLRLSIESLDLNTKLAAKAQNELAKYYEGGSASVNASIAASAATMVTDPKTGMAVPRSALSGASNAAETERKAKEALGGVRPPSLLKSLKAAALAPSGERSEAFITGGGGGPSRPKPVAKEDLPWGRGVPDDIAADLTIPQFGELTTQNILRFLSGTAFRRSQQQAGTEGGPSGERAGLASNLLYRASEWSARWQAAKMFAGRYGYEISPHDLAGTGGLQGLGALAGATGGGDVNVLGMGVRIPFLDPQFRKGLSEEWQRTKFAAQAGINKTQVNTVFGNLYNEGWLGGDRTNQMRRAGVDIMKYNTQLGNNPAIYQAMDKATRLGAESLKGFVGVVKQIPDAAKAAHVSLDQMVQDGNALGEINQSQGGTYATGFRNAQYLAQLTGLPAGVMAQMFENPLVQSQAMLNTGLGPWMQGLQTPSERLQSMFGAVNSMSSGTQFGNRMVDDHGVAGKFGFRHFVGGSQQQDAMLSQLLGVSPEWVHKMKDKGFQQRVLIGSELLGAGEDWSAKVHRVAGRHGPWKALFDMHANRTGNLGDLHKMMTMAVDQQGKQMFTPKDIKSVMNAAKTNGKWVPGSRKWIPEVAPSADGLWQARKAHWEVTKGHWEGTTPQQAAEKAQKKLRELYAKKVPNPSDPNAPKVTIDLSPAARKLFGIKTDAKDKANAGQVSVNTGYGTGPTTVGPFGPGSGYDSYGGGYGYGG